MVGSTLIYYQRVPTDGARRLGCAGILVLCCRLPASGLLRPEARWPDKVLFSAEKSGAASRLWPAGRGGWWLWRCSLGYDWGWVVHCLLVYGGFYLFLEPEIHGPYTVKGGDAG